MQFKKWADTYLNIYLKPRIKKHTYYIYLSILNNHILPFFNKYEIEDIKVQDINIFINILLNKSNKNGEKLNASTINLIIIFLKSIFKEAFESEIISKNPIIRIKTLPIIQKEITVLSKQDQNKLVDYCILNIDDSRYLGIILTLYTGLRIGELLGLTWKNIDLRERIIKITQILSKINNQYEITSPKTSSSIRFIPISNQLEMFLRLEKNKKLSEFVISYHNKHCLIRSYQYFFSMVLKKLNIKYVNFHVLRHTFATRCLEIGIDIKTISEIMGHKNATITLNRYSHSTIKTKRKALNQLSKSINVER